MQKESGQAWRSRHLSGAGGHRQFCLPKFAHVRLSRALEVHRRSFWIFPTFKFENRSRTTCPAVGLSPFSPSITIDVNVSIATSLHQCLPFSSRVHHLFKSRHSMSYSNHSQDHGIKTYTCTVKKKHIHIRIRSRISIEFLHIYLRVIMNQSSRTPQHSKWNCVGTNRPQHMHIYSHIVCDWTLNTPKFRIVQKYNLATTKFEFESANWFQKPPKSFELVFRRILCQTSVSKLDRFLFLFMECKFCE